MNQSHFGIPSDFNDKGAVGYVIRGYFSILALLPKHGMGFFVCNNGYYEGLIWAVVDGVIKHYFPSDPPAPKPLSGFMNKLSRFKGRYRHIKHAYTTPEKLGTLRAQELAVKPDPKGSLLHPAHPL